VWAATLLAAVAVVGGGIWLIIGGVPGRADAPGRGGEDRVPIAGQVPDFSLTERSGSIVTKRSLEGRVWIADFIFTRCQGVCPLLSGRMADLQSALRDRSDVTLISFSVDPDHDTPEVLSRYAKGYDADAERWLFLTGERESMYRLIGEGFHLAVAEAEPGKVPEGELITHSDRLVLVDRRGRIRGSYHGTDEDVTKRLLADLDVVLAER
jgi:cytochrome oxidase Cu insertion factor (SCO1/SenC/PrrC family)